MTPKSKSPRSVADTVRAAVPDATDDEIDQFAKQVIDERAPDDLERYVAGFPATRIITRIAAVRRQRHADTVAANGRQTSSCRSGAHPGRRDTACMTWCTCACHSETSGYPAYFGEPAPLPANWGEDPA